MGNNKPKKKKGFGDFLLTLILIAAIGVFGFAAYNLYHIYTEYKKGTDEYNRIEQMAVTERDPDAQAAEEDGGPGLKAPIDVDFDTLRAINDDVIAWIYVEGLEGLSYPVVRGIDNDFYLHRTYEKNYNFAGTIFIDCDNNDDFNDCNTLVYGHNMKNGSMFGNLKQFMKGGYAYENSKYFWILTPDKNYRYEVISAYTTPVNSDTYTIFKGPGQEFLDYMDMIVKNSEIDTTPGELTVQDKIVTLSTCTTTQTNRFVVQGKRVNAVDVE